MSIRDSKISFCTVCMNRAEHLKLTLPANIESNKDYKNIEFLILDYNSEDDVQDFVIKSFPSEIENGKLVYYKTLTPDVFNRSHSRNLSFKLATGEIICNIDADNFTGDGFASFIAQQFKIDSDIFLSAFEKNKSNSGDVLGRICLKKEHFHKLRGYDERMENHGFEDTDFVNRLILSGLKSFVIPADKGFLHAIKHDDGLRIKNENLLKNLNILLVSYISPACTEFLFINKNEKFKIFTLIDNKAFDIINSTRTYDEQGYVLSLAKELTYEGGYSFSEANIVLNINNQSTLLAKQIDLNNSSYFITNNEKEFFIITNPQNIQSIILCISQLYNRLILTGNVTLGEAVVNTDFFGTGIVYKNGEFSKPIIIN
ncbi:MAG: glycosyltransferase family A protein [Mucilaginibacter sp.]|uniref:glycosyltransferase family 2 protein n=1 Tax=Mucilaginibacter sp. TaxID=1882438 RepID=UPI0032659529